MSVFAIGFRMMLAAACLLVAAGPAGAAQVAGITYEETASVGGQDLQLNGLGVRTRVVFKVYSAGLYLPGKSGKVEDILAMDGARRVRIVMLRQVRSEDFAQAFVEGLNKNMTASEKDQLVSQITQLGRLFATVPKLDKGDVLLLDWVPEVGTVISLNDRRMGAPLPDLAFYNALLKIWLGNNPVDSTLKTALLGPGR